jgi:hypothetical protein
MKRVRVRIRFETPEQHEYVRDLERRIEVEVHILRGRVTETISKVEVDLQGPERALCETLRDCREHGLEIRTLSQERP